MNYNAVLDARFSKQLKRCLFGVTVMAAVYHSQAAPGDPDPSFAGPSMNGTVHAITLQSDGKILICGGFMSIAGSSRNWFARLNSDGRLDPTFLPGMSGPDGGVEAVTVQADGKILVGGGFGKINGVDRPRLARLNPDGSVDASFLSSMSGPSSTVHCLAVLNEGKIFVGGEFYSVNGVARTNLARLNSDGSVDLSFGHVPPASSLINLPYYSSGLGQMAVQKDGKLIAWRAVFTYYGDWHGNDYQLARFNSDASLDVEFPHFSHAGWYANPGISAITIQDDGKILVGGDFDWPRTNIVRLTPYGTLDYSFAPVVDGAVSAMALQPDGRIIVCGFFTSVNGWPRTNIARLNVDGSIDPSFWARTDGGAAVYTLAMHDDNRVLLGGGTMSVNGVPFSGLARLMTSDIPPAILRPPQTRTCEEGSSVSFFLDAAGFPTPACQWYFNGSPLDDCTSLNLYLGAARPSDSGTYVAILTNVAGAITSTPAALNVIPAVPRSSVPALQLIAEIGSQLNLEYSDVPLDSATWLPLDALMQTTAPEFRFDVAGAILPQRFYRAWQSGTPGSRPLLKLNIVPAIALTGETGRSLRLDGINAIGPTNAWLPLATVILTNTSQLFFDVSAIDQPQRLYRIVPVP